MGDLQRRRDRVAQADGGVAPVPGPALGVEAHAGRAGELLLAQPRHHCLDLGQRQGGLLGRHRRPDRGVDELAHGRGQRSVRRLDAVDLVTRDLVVDEPADVAQALLLSLVCPHWYAARAASSVAWRTRP